MHQLDATAAPFDPISNCIAGQVEDKQFSLFLQLQQLNTTLRELQYQLNHISIPNLKQINCEMLNANANQYYALNPVLYLQIQHKQNIIMQTVQYQQLQCNQLQKQINVIQNQYQTVKQEEIQEALQKSQLESHPKPQPQNHDDDIKEEEKEEKINVPHEANDINNKILSIVIEESSYIIKSDDKIICDMSEEKEEHTSETAPKEQDEQDENTMTQVSVKEENKYLVSDLLQLQPKYMEIDWINNQCIPRDIRIIYQHINQKEFMSHVIASISRKCEDRFRDPNRTICMDKKTQHMKKLKGILNKMCPEKFDKIANDTMSIISDYVNETQEMEHVLELILEFGIKQPKFGEEYAKLIEYLFDYLPEIMNDNISNEFRSMVIILSNKLFLKYNQNKTNDKKPFISFLKLCGDLYNVNMMNSGVICKGIINELIGNNNNNITGIDIEGICKLFKECGNKLENENRNCVDKYLKQMKILSNKFDFRTQCLVDEIKEMRDKNWTNRIKEEKPQTLDRIRNQFDKQQTNTGTNNHNKKKKYNNNRYNENHCEIGYDYDEPDEYNNYNTYNNNSYGRYHRYD